MSQDYIDIKDLDSETLYSIGRSFQFGHGADCNWKKALEIYRELARRNYAPGIFSLGECYFYGHGTRSDKVKANELFLQAAGYGSVDAIMALAGSYACGFGVNANPNMVFGLYTAAASTGSMKGQHKLADCYRDGIGTSVDLQKAVHWYTQAARQGYPYAMYQLAICYAEGLGVDESLAAAEDWCLEATRQGMQAAEYLHDALRSNDLLPNGVGDRTAEMVAYLGQLAEEGLPLGKRLLANCYLRGIGVVQNGDMAYRLLTQAAEAGSVPAMRTLGEWYHNGFGTQPDPQKAEYWYSRGAQLCDPTAMRLLAIFNLEDAETPQPEQAEALLLQAAAMGDAESAYLLAEQYLAGTFSCVDEAETEATAVRLLQQAAQLGYYDAQLKLAELSD